MADGDTMRGFRMPDVVLGEPSDGWACWKHPEPGWYAKVLRPDGSTAWWQICDPSGHQGIVGRHHTVTEFADDPTVITVAPSILATKEEHGHDWHGYLERGIWREV
jgi:hypothetical protein